MRSPFLYYERRIGLRLSWCVNGLFRLQHGAAQLKKLKKPCSSRGAWKRGPPGNFLTRGMLWNQ